MALSLIGSGNINATSTTSAVVVSVAIAINDLIVTTVKFTGSNSIPVTNITDNQGNIHTLIRRNAGGGINCATEIWWSVATAVTPSLTCTGVWPAATIVMATSVFRGNNKNWNLHTSSFNTEVTAVLAHPCAAVGAIDTTIPESIIVGAGTLVGSGAVGTPAPGFTAISLGGSSRAMLQYKIAIAVETDQRAIYTWGSVKPSNNVIAAFTEVPVLADFVQSFVIM